MNPITEFYKNNQSLQSTKLAHYFDIYWKHFQPKSKQSGLKILEIGVRNGGSLLCWKNVFNNPRIHGVDINPDCKSHEEHGFKIVIGDQSDPAVWNRFNQQMGGMDIVIDDGSHVDTDILTTFNKLFPTLNPGGIYLMEDVSSEAVYKNFGSRTPLVNKTDDLYSNNYCSLSFYNKIIILEKMPPNFSIDCIHSGTIQNHALPHGISNDQWKETCNNKP